ncbi:uncharacterized protein BP01DRAFT_396628 [Aspergillus saccharolyticus JOP 1030-1]|uniref:Uncharacterized protein n=1 Tax=Aspergillus saccharolyticus JOP 1030-1 TaxID=1450539 RepID=A0A319AEL5_9EURO|nr:hypothetical protein BP01DRAFT_396628 [Aspergillus saccharolyticus JOP 1030-1]PYH49938.1 hypothetical protein BP01DRAFT_396628 [Aspergillus saccharolyticus JOP 1030-1]
MAGAKTKSDDDIPQADAQFIVRCLMNMTSERQVDLNGVAAALGHTNVQSTANRFRTLRKRYGFELEATHVGSPSKTDNASAGDTGGQDVQVAPEIATPTKRKASVKGNPRKKAKAKAKPASTDELNHVDEAEIESELDPKVNTKSRKKGAAARTKPADKGEAMVAPEEKDETVPNNEVI